MAFCNDQDITCDVCFEQSTFTDCDLTFTVSLADGDYFFTVIDKFGAGYTNEYTVASGSMTLTKTDFPDGFFNNYSGYYEMFAHSTATAYTRLTIYTTGGTNYPCIIFDLDSVCCTE